MSDKLTKNIAGLNDSVKQYVQARIDLVKLQLLKKVSQSLSFIFGLFVFILIAVLVLMFSGAAFAFWYGNTYNNYLEGVLIVVGFLVLISVLFLLLKNKILTSVFLRNFSEILFEDENNKKE